MAVRLYVGNLPFSMTEDDLQDLFSQSGAVISANIITDRDTGRSRGFAFVEMETSEAAHAAIEALNGIDVNGRALTVNEAKPKESRGPRGGGYGGGSGGYNRDRGGRGGNRY
ncbi:MAG: RNA recognition motif domain-containing protein [Blastocatellales bacterium]